MTEIIDAPTRPLTDAEKNPEIPERPKRLRLPEPDSEANLQRLFLSNGWTDGLPIVLPTEERVPEGGIKLDENPLRMPAYHECEDGLCIFGR